MIILLSFNLRLVGKNLELLLLSITWTKHSSEPSEIELRCKIRLEGGCVSKCWLMNSDLELCWGFECRCINLPPQCSQKGWGSRFPLGAAVPGLPLLSVFPQQCHSHDLIAPTQTPELEGFSFSITDDPGLTAVAELFSSPLQFYDFLHFFLNWGPSRTSICHGVTISSYLPDGEQFRSWTAKVLPIKLGHINKLSYILCH